MQSVEQWADLRRLHFVQGVSIKELHRRTGLHRQTIRRALRSSEPPRYEREATASKLDPFKDEIHRLLREDPRLPNTRIGELIVPLGYAGRQTILDEYVREVRPLFLPAVRTYQRTEYRPGAIAQFDLWQPEHQISVGFGQTRRAYVVVGALGYSRVGSGALIFSKEIPDLLWGVARCLRSFGGLPETLVWDREGALHAGNGKPTEAYAAFVGALKVGWQFCAPGDAEAKGVVERLQQFFETSFEPAATSPGRSTCRNSWIAGSTEEPTCACTARCANGPSTVWPRSARRCALCPSTSPTSTGASCCASRRSRTCASTPMTTRSIRGSSVAGSRSSRRSAASALAPWTAARSPAITSGPLPATAPSPRSITRVACTSCAASPPSPRSSADP